MDGIWDDGVWISWEEINRHLCDEDYNCEPDFFIEKLIHVSALYQSLYERTLIPYSFLENHLERIISEDIEDTDIPNKTDTNRIRNQLKLYKEGKLKSALTNADVNYVSLLHLAAEYHEMQNFLSEDNYEDLKNLHTEHLPIYGELGECYASQRFGINLHPPMAQGSDGAMKTMLVEVKTITPVKLGKYVTVKRSGNWGVLAIVKIDTQFRIDAKLIKRSKLPKGTGKYIRVYWDEYKSEHFDISPEYLLSGARLIGSPAY